MQHSSHAAYRIHHSCQRPGCTRLYNIYGCLLVAEAQVDASRERFPFSKKKKRTMVISSKKKTDPKHGPDITLYGTKSETFNAEVHLCISRSSDCTKKNTTTRHMQVAKWNSYTHMGAGCSGLNGIGLEVSKHIWDIYVMPRLTCGLKALVLSLVEGKTLQGFHRNHLNMLQHLPRSTVKHIYLLFVSPLLEVQLHIHIITFFICVLHHQNVIEQIVI